MVGCVTLWTKPIDKITYTDVVDFCANNTPEGVNLDYKSDVPEKLPKVCGSLKASRPLMLFRTKIMFTFAAET